MSCLDLLFTDQRKAVVLVYGWLGVTFVIFSQIGMANSTFVKCGPSSTAVLANTSIVIDTWTKWILLACFNLISTIITVFVQESMFPWITHVIQDRTVTQLPYPKSICMLIVIAFYLYQNIIWVLGLFMMFIQIDFLVIRFTADIFTSIYTTHNYLKHKSYTPPHPINSADESSSPTDLNNKLLESTVN